MRGSNASRGLGRDRLLAAAFVVLVSTAIVGFSSAETGASFTASTTNPGQSWNTATVQPPTSPTGTSAVAGAVNLGWTASTSTPVGTQTRTYLVLRRPAGSGAYAQVGSATSALTASDTPVADGSYDYVVQTKIAQGAGFFTSVNSAVQTVKSDRTAPTMSITCNAAACGAGWYTAAVAVVVSGTDGAGVGMGSVTTKIDTAAAVTTAGSSASISVSGDSTGHSVVYSGKDAVTNTSANVTQTIKIDGTAPTNASGLTAVTGATTLGTVTLSWTAGSDATSGLAGYTIRRTGIVTACPAATPANYPTTYAAGAVTTTTVGGMTSGSKYCFYIAANDNAGNASAASAPAGPVRAK
ncbi:MAG TPA: hypothetical protein VM070_01305 [Candidatus Saccharimonadales bacterium]|nr:hypothetical protein [Candidatus Saccharimonadales bacterium]